MSASDEPTSIQQPNRPAQLGRHWLVDFEGCRDIPSQASVLQTAMEKAATLVGATIISSTFHAFQPQGLSGVVVIAESHLAVHTWPEHGAVCVDLFTCSSTMDAEPGIEFLKQTFGAQTVKTQILPRGVRDQTRSDADG